MMAERTRYRFALGPYVVAVFDIDYAALLPGTLRYCLDDRVKHGQSPRDACRDIGRWPDAELVCFEVVGRRQAPGRRRVVA